MIEAENEVAGELHAFQGKDETLSREIGALKNTLKVLDSLLSADQAQAEMMIQNRSTPPAIPFQDRRRVVVWLSGHVPNLRRTARTFCFA